MLTAARVRTDSSGAEAAPGVSARRLRQRADAANFLPISLLWRRDEGVETSSGPDSTSHRELAVVLRFENATEERRRLRSEGKHSMYLRPLCLGLMSMFAVLGASDDRATAQDLPMTGTSFASHESTVHCLGLAADARSASIHAPPSSACSVLLESALDPGRFVWLATGTVPESGEIQVELPGRVAAGLHLRLVIVISEAPSTAPDANDGDDKPPASAFTTFKADGDGSVTAYPPGGPKQEIPFKKGDTVVMTDKGAVFVIRTKP